MATTKEGLISFQKYIENMPKKPSGDDFKNPPFVIKAKDLDENFLRVVARAKAKWEDLFTAENATVQIERLSDQQKVDVRIPITTTRDKQGQNIHYDMLLADMMLNGKLRQVLIPYRLVPEKGEDETPANP